jgi:hypothetical protein
MLMKLGNILSNNTHTHTHMQAKDRHDEHGYISDVHTESVFIQSMPESYTKLAYIHTYAHTLAG